MCLLSACGIVPFIGPIINLFIWPTLILLILMNVLPLVYSLYLSFTDYSAIANQAPTWVAFENFGLCFSKLKKLLFSKSWLFSLIQRDS